MASLLTGATGFIGRHLVERLLARDGEIVIVRAPRLDARARVSCSPTHGCASCEGDLELPLLGVEESWLAAARGTIERAFHLAALYDMRAAARRRRCGRACSARATLVALAAALDARCLHHVSSVAVAGRHRGVFTRAGLRRSPRSSPRPTTQAKFEAERIVREQTALPWRIYRPSVVVGDSRSGEMDKIDGPYYFFKAIAAHAPPDPRVGAAGRPRARAHQHRPGRLRRRRDRPHLAPARASTGAPST